MPLSRYRGIFEPADLDLLQRVFDQVRIERRLGQK
ncbi:MAG: RNA-binding protein, partial [Mesorhizobium sp.]